MKIELLYFEDCPAWQQGLDNFESVLALCLVSDRILVSIAVALSGGSGVERLCNCYLPGFHWLNGVSWISFERS